VELDAVADELYGLRPDEFTAARDERARAARAEGDPYLAARIRELRRPTLSAWAGNLLVRRRPEEVGPLLALGQELRRAHRELDGERLRELSRHQWRLLTALSRQAGQLAAEAGHPLGEQALREVEQTMKAVLADPASAEEWAAGRLTRPLPAPSGFGTEESAGGPSASAGVADLAEERARRRGRGGGRTGARTGRAAEPAREKPERTKEKAGEKAGEKARARAEERAQAEAREKARARAREAREKAEAAERRAHEQDAELSEARRESEAAEERRRATDQEVARLTDRLHRAESEQHSALDAERRARQRLRAADRAVRDARRAARDAARHADRLASEANTDPDPEHEPDPDPEREPAAGTGTGTEGKAGAGGGRTAGRRGPGTRGRR